MQQLSHIVYTQSFFFIFETMETKVFNIHLVGQHKYRETKKRNLIGTKKYKKKNIMHQCMYPRFAYAYSETSRTKQ